MVGVQKVIFASSGCFKLALPKAAQLRHSFLGWKVDPWWTPLWTHNWLSEIERRREKVHLPVGLKLGISRRFRLSLVYCSISWRHCRQRLAIVEVAQERPQVFAGDDVIARLPGLRRWRGWRRRRRDDVGHSNDLPEERGVLELRVFA